MSFPDKHLPSAIIITLVSDGLTHANYVVSLWQVVVQDPRFESSKTLEVQTFNASLGCKFHVTHGNWWPILLEMGAETPSLQKQERYNLYDF